jgi:hypothetical protein
MAAGGTAWAAKADLNGIWLPANRNVLLTVPGATQAGGGAQPASIPPYKPDWAAKFQATLAASRAGKITVDPTARCLPPGMPRTMSTIFPFEISIEPDRVLVLFEVGGVRRIWTDGRKHPSELDPTFMGDSIGHWEGDVLVVDTAGLRGDTVFDATGSTHSDQMHVIERIRVVSAEKLDDSMTIEDPIAFEHPWQVTYTYDRKRGWQIMEMICEENNRGVDPNGSGPGL